MEGRTIKLIDADSLFETLRKMDWFDNMDRDLVLDILFDTEPVIILPDDKSDSL